jgi:metallo-beta-lactamase class B
MLRTVLFFLTSTILLAQPDPTWSKPYPAHRIAGNLYYVGTEGLACFLFSSPEGHILINTGLSDSTPLIRESMRQLGFKLEDVRILLTMQAHYDHVAAMQEIQKISGAKAFITEGDAPVMEDGGQSDPFLGPKYRFPPVKVDRRLKDGDVVSLGGTQLRVILTPGHTKGSVSYETSVMDQGVKRTVLIANMGTVIMPLVGNTKYPNIAADFEQAFAKQKKLSPQIWVAAHSTQYDMEAKRKSGSFVDPDGYRRAVEHYERLFQETLEKEQRQAKSR